MAPSGPPAKAKAESKAKPKAEGKAKPKAKKVEEPEIEKPPQPDKAVHDEALKKIADAIEKLQKKQADISKKISERSGGKEEYFNKRQEIRDRLDAAQAEVDALAGKKNELYEQIGQVSAADREQKEALKKAQKDMKYGSAEDIDKKIADIEFAMWTSSLSLKDEKKYLAEISELKRAKPKLSNIQKMAMEAESNKANAGKSRDELREQTKTLGGNIKEAIDRKKLIQEELKKLNEERQKQQEGMPEVFEERQKISTQIQEKIAERNKLRDEYRELERGWNAYLNEKRKAQAEAAAASRQERQAEYEERKKARAVEQLEEQPHIAEITLVNQTIAWCNSVVAKKTKKEEESKKAAPANLNNPEGSMVLLKKDNREDEFYFAPTKQGKKKGKNQKEESTSSKALKHNAETFRLFHSLNLDAPLKEDEIPAILEKLEAQLEDYNKKVKDWEENREKKKAAILEGNAEEDKEEAKAEEE